MVEQEMDIQEGLSVGLQVRLILQRFFEMLVPCALLSAVGTIVYVAGFVPTKISLMILLTAELLLFGVVHFIMLRQCYVALADNKMYFKINLMAYGVFLLVSLALFFMFDNEGRNYPYTWLFAITKFLRHSPISLSNLMSAGIFHGIMILLICTAPQGMGWVFEPEEEDEEE